MISLMLAAMLLGAGCAGQKAQDSGCEEEGFRCPNLQDTDCSKYGDLYYLCDNVCNRVWECTIEYGWYLYSDIQCDCVLEDGTLRDAPECEPTKVY